MFLFGAGALIATTTMDIDGNPVAVPTPYKFGTLQEVSGDISFESKSLYGSQQFAVATGRGKAKFDFKAKVGNFDVGLLSMLLGRSGQTGMRSVKLNEPVTISAGKTTTVVPPSSGVFAADQGVINATTGRALKRVAANPAAGQYSVDPTNGQYTWGDDVGILLYMSYEYTTTSTGTTGVIMNEDMGAAPFFSAALQSKYRGKIFNLKLNRCISNKLSLPFKNEDFLISDFEFSAMADDAGQVGSWSLSDA